MTTLNDKAVGRVMFNLGYITGAINGIDCEPSVKDQLQSSLAQIEMDITKENTGDGTTKTGYGKNVIWKSAGLDVCRFCGKVWKTAPDRWRCSLLPDQPEVLGDMTCAEWRPKGGTEQGGIDDTDDATA